jgi:hypothetical protein
VFASEEAAQRGLMSTIRRALPSNIRCRNS